MEATSTPRDFRLTKRRVEALSAELKASKCRMDSILQQCHKEARLLKPHNSMPHVLPCVFQASLIFMRLLELTDFVVKV